MPPATTPPRSTGGRATSNLPKTKWLPASFPFTLLKHEIDSLHPGRRAPWQRLFNAALARFRACDSILPVNLDIAIRAAELRSLSLETDLAGHRESLGDLGILVAATALEEHLTLVDRRQPYHQTLEAAHGLTFHDPYP